MRRIAACAAGLTLVAALSGCGGSSKNRAGAKPSDGASTGPPQGTLTVETLSFQPPDGMARVENDGQDVALTLAPGGRTQNPGEKSPPGLVVFKGGRDLGGVALRRELIKGAIQTKTPDVQFSTKPVSIPGAADAEILDTTYPSGPGKQVDVIIGTASGPQYDIRYWADQSRFDSAGAERMISSIRIAGGGE
ncbi:hypothetical protein AB0J52_07795 [Spirillospora sp. NPDC049652]